MANTLYEINNSPDENRKNIQLMTVTDVHNGEAISLVTEDKLEFEYNFIHSSSVPILVTGDQVIVQQISDQFVITDKIRATNEKPTIGFEINGDGSLSIHSAISIHFKTENAKIEILENGKILIDGNEIYSLSNGINRMQGTSIELN